ncbi:MAG: PHP domain-containing protein [Clostridiales bacterium]|nr:PHP domain-containing protein [Clostridiales bacterium]
MNGQYKWELHAHTRQSSKCGWMDAEDVVKEHIKAGYDGMVITDHYNNANIERFYGTPLEQAQVWTGGWRAARAAAEGTGLTVLFGLEARLQDNDNDYLIFGVEPRFVLENPQLNFLTLKELHALCHAHGAVMIQAHPNRKGCSPAPWQDVDGYEVLNGNLRHDNHNDLTEAIAQAHPELIYTAGSDYHRVEDVGTAPVYTDRQIRTGRDLVRCLREGAFRWDT